MPGAAKAALAALLSTYLQTRAQLRGMILMMDSRRPLTDLDRQHDRVVRADRQADPRAADEMRQIDATGKHQRVARDEESVWRNITAAGYRGELTAQLFSALKRVGIDEAHELIESWLIPEAKGETDARAVSAASSRARPNAHVRPPIKKPAA